MCVVFISTSSLGPPNNVSECIGGIYLLPLLKGLSSDKNMEYYKYLQKWLFITAESKATAHIVQAWSPPEGSESHGFSLTSYKSFFFFNESSYLFPSSSSGKVFERKRSFLSKE